MPWLLCLRTKQPPCIELMTFWQSEWKITQMILAPPKGAWSLAGDQWLCASNAINFYSPTVWHPCLLCITSGRPQSDCGRLMNSLLMVNWLGPNGSIDPVHAEYVHFSPSIRSLTERGNSECLSRSQVTALVFSSFTFYLSIWPVVHQLGQGWRERDKENQHQATELWGLHFLKHFWIHPWSMLKHLQVLCW